MGWGVEDAEARAGWAWRAAGGPWDGMGGTGRGEDRETAHRRRGPGTEGTAEKEAVGGPWRPGAGRAGRMEGSGARDALQGTGGAFAGVVGLRGGTRGNAKFGSRYVFQKWERSHFRVGDRRLDGE
jgi:hypothetical protein